MNQVTTEPHTRRVKTAEAMHWGMSRQIDFKKSARKLLLKIRTLFMHYD